MIVAAVFFFRVSTVDAGLHRRRWDGILGPPPHYPAGVWGAPRARVSPVQGKCPWDSHALTSISKVLAPTVLLRTVEGFAAFACWEWSLNF